MNSDLTEENVISEDYRFEIDADLVEKFTGSIKIFMADKRTIRKISNRLLILGSIFLIFSIPASISLIRGFHLNISSVLGLLGLFGVYLGFYLRINATRFPLIIVYEDKILFKKKSSASGAFRIFNALYLYNSNKFESIQKKEIKNILKLKSILSTDIYFELHSNNSTIQPLLNIEKEYRDHIFLYLQEYMNNKS
ncbi:hypothetical protein [Cytophaga aurantiaca]|uniref:hypothetical protein n=1 Tax=Cytophaga aurantiaca TaxID=29530 RepID=UPI0003607B3C|nr:hypothetical protein [Cytophaga aurantiaca]